jgi:hypothetical protein
LWEKKNTQIAISFEKEIFCKKISFSKLIAIYPPPAARDFPQTLFVAALVQFGANVVIFLEFL